MLLKHHALICDVQMFKQKEPVKAALKRLSAASNKPGLSERLPETLPAGVLCTPYMQSLQQALLPFQVCAGPASPLPNPQSAFLRLSLVTVNLLGLLWSNICVAECPPKGLPG